VTNQVPVGSGIRALHVRTGAPALSARVANWFSDHNVQATSCDDAFDAVTHLIQHPDAIPDLVLIGLDWLTDDDFTLLAYIHDTWPAAAVITYVQESLHRSAEPQTPTVVCQSPEELSVLLSNPPAAVLGAVQAARLRDPDLRTPPAAPLEKPSILQAPDVPRAPELPPLRAATERGSTDNAHSARHSPLRTVTRPADLLTPEELAALLKQDFR
jgi:hypothetical protein